MSESVGNHTSGSVKGYNLVVLHVAIPVQIVKTNIIGYLALKIRVLN